MVLHRPRDADRYVSLDKAVFRLLVEVVGPRSEALPGRHHLAHDIAAQEAAGQMAVDRGAVVHLAHDPVDKVLLDAMVGAKAYDAAVGTVVDLVAIEVQALRVVVLCVEGNRGRVVEPQVMDVVPGDERGRAAANNLDAAGASVMHVAIDNSAELVP